MNIEILKTAKEQLMVRSSRNVQHATHCHNIESINIFLVLPFLQFLGYDITNPEELFPHYIFNPSVHHADLVLLKGEHPSIICNVVLSGAFSDVARLRLKDAFATANMTHPMPLAILTDGIVYELYTDLSVPKVMDAEPYFSFSMASLVENDSIDPFVVEHIAFLSKSYFNPAEVFSRAVLESVRRYGLDALSSFVEESSFIRLVVEKVLAFKNYDTTRVSDSLIGLSKPVILSFLSNLMQHSIATPAMLEDSVLTSQERAFVDYATSVIFQFLEKQKTSDTYLKKVHALKEKQFLQLYYSSPSLGVFVAVQEKGTRFDVRFSASDQPLVLEGDDFLTAIKRSSDFQPLLLKSFTAVVNNIKQ